MDSRANMVAGTGVCKPDSRYHARMSEIPTPQPRRVRWPLSLAWLALASCVLAIAGFAAALEGYSHAGHPVGWLGGRGLPGASAFNLLAYILPGVLLALVAWCWREGLPATAGIGARLGAWLMLLSALAFAAKGVLPLDLEELDAGASRGHASAWMLWLIASVTGMWLSWLGLRRRPGQAGLARACLSGGILFPAATLLLPGVLAAGHAQRLALLLWFGWWLLVAHRLSRGAVSSPG